MDQRERGPRGDPLPAVRLDWLDPVKEAIFVRRTILARHAAQARRDTLDSDGLQHGQFKVLLMLRASVHRTLPARHSSPTCSA